MGEIIWSDGKGKRQNQAPPIVSSNLGVMDLQVDDFREDAKRHGFTSVEFVKSEDFAETGFYDVHCSSPEQYREYVKHRGLVDKNSSNGSAPVLSEEELNRAAEAVQRSYRWQY